MNFEVELGKAVRHFWLTRDAQHSKQGGATGVRDQGNRGAVTGGKHADGFVGLIAAIVRDAGLSRLAIHTHTKTARTLPGYFRPSKEWDIVVTSGQNLVAVVEVKSQVGSFGNNFNNRVEEALGNATDFWTAYREGIFQPSAKPWLGYLFMLEACEGSVRPTKRVELAPFKVSEEFQELSYCSRYERVCLRLVREKLYDAACFFTSEADSGIEGTFHEPNVELGIRNFAVSLHARALSFAQLQA